MSLKINKTDTYTQVAFSGRLDTAAATGAESEVKQVIEKENKHIIVDCAGLEYISSSGLRLFLMLQKLAAARQVKLGVCSLKSNIREVFDISGFSGIFTIYSDLETAIKD